MSKYSIISDELKSEIRQGKYSKTGKLPTEYELVERFKVSRQTVRQAIACLKSEGIVSQIQGSGTFVCDLGARKNRKNKENLTIAVICTYISDYIFPSIIRGIEESLSGDNYVVNLVATGNKVDKERSILEKIIYNSEVDGIIVEGTKTGLPNPNISLYRKIKEMGIPIVFVHCAYPELDSSVVVGMKDYEGGKMAVNELIRQGCRKIAGIFKSDDRQGLLRYSGFSDGLLEGGLGLDCAEIKWYTTEDLEDFIVNDNCVQSLLSKGIDSVVCYNDQIAVRFIKAAAECNKDVPKLISFDNSYLCKASLVGFTSLGHRKEELGKVAAEKIKNMLNGKPEETVLLDWE